MLKNTLDESWISDTNSKNSFLHLLTYDKPRNSSSRSIMSKYKTRKKNIIFMPKSQNLDIYIQYTFSSKIFLRNEIQNDFYNKRN